MINKIISGIMAIGLLLSVLTLPAAANVTESKTSSGNEAFKKLVSLGILDSDDGYVDNAEISRGDFTKIAMKLCGNIVDAYKSNNVFGDVNIYSDNAKYINSAYAMGFVNGSGDGNFYPESTISFAEAIKLTVCAIGYQPIAEASGSYPDGYMNAAIKAKLLNGLKSNSNVVTWNGAMVLIENAINADICEADLSENNKFYIKNDRTILEERFSVYKADGIVTANEYTDLMASDSDLKKGRVIIDEVEYDVGKTSAEDYLGINTEIYYKDDDSADVPILMYITPRDDDNRIVELDEEDIISAEKSKIKYILSDKEHTAAISQHASLIYNGKMTELTESRLIPAYGTVTLIDNDNDSLYDVIKVMEYEAYVVQNISAVTNTVTTKQGKVIELDTNSEDYYTLIKNNEETKTFEDIKSDQTILYAESISLGKPIKTVLLSDKKISGKVNSVSKTDNVINIDDTEYKIKASLKNIVKLRGDGKFYIDARDRIVYVDYTNDIVYGYITGIKQETFGDIFLKIFTENSHWVTLQLDNKIKFNDKSVTNSAARDLLGTIPDDYCQLIRYLVNSDGKITTIETAENISFGSDEEENAIQNDTFRISAEGETYFRTSTNSFNGIVTVGSNSKIFAVSTDSSDLKEDNVMIKSVSDLENDEKYKFKAYNANSVRTSPIFVIYDYNNASQTEMLLVRNTDGEMLSEDDVCPALDGYLRGINLVMPVSLRDDSPVKDVTDLKNGDIVTFGCNNKGEIDYLEKRASNDSEYNLAGGLYSTKTYISGYITKFDTDDKKAVIKYDSLNSSAVFSLGSIKNFYIYDVKYKDFNIGGINDLREGDRVVARMRNLVCTEMFILRNCE